MEKGSLLQKLLNPDERSQLGNYSDSPYNIEMLTHFKRCPDSKFVSTLHKVIRRDFLLIFFILSALVFNPYRQGYTEVPVPPESQPQSIATPPAPVASSNLHIKINIPKKELSLYNGDTLLKQYPVAIGMPQYPTPTGAYTISRIEWNPWWLPPDSPWAKGAKPTPPGRGNPLGPVKMMMGDALRIHGTNKDGSVGHAASHGCMRMHNEDAKDLAWILQIHNSQKTDEALREKYRKNSGTTFYVALDSSVPVDLIYNAIELLGTQLILHPDVYGKVKRLKDKIIEVVSQANLDASILDPEKLSKLKKPAKESVTIPLQQIVVGSNLFEKWMPSNP